MKNKVSFKVFIWAIGLITTIIAWILICQSNDKVDIYKRMDGIERNTSNLMVDMSAVRTDVSWIKNTMNNQNNISLK